MHHLIVPNCFCNEESLQPAIILQKLFTQTLWASEGKDSGIAVACGLVTFVLRESVFWIYADVHRPKGKVQLFWFAQASCHKSLEPSVHESAHIKLLLHSFSMLAIVLSSRGAQLLKIRNTARQIDIGDVHTNQAHLVHPWATQNMFAAAKLCRNLARCYPIDSAIFPRGNCDRALHPE